jgi:hypothetical protein
MGTMQTAERGAIDEAKLTGFLGKVVGDYGAVMSAALVLIGERLGLYEAMADGALVTSLDLSQKTGIGERYLREWLVN